MVDNQTRPLLAYEELFFTKGTESRLVCKMLVPSGP